MIDPEVMAQIRALSEEIVILREDISHLSSKLDGNNANLIQYTEREIAKARDAADRATQNVLEITGQLQVFSDEQRHFKTEFEWWADHLTKLTAKADATIKLMGQLQVKLALDNKTFMDWAVEKINQIGRIFRR